MKKIAFIFSLVVILVLSLVVLIIRPNKLLAKENNNINPHCATSSLLSDNALEGKRQFYINCAMCHKLNGIVDPPLLQNRFKNYKLKEFKQFLYNTKRERINDFPIECKSFTYLNEEKIENIYEYLDYYLTE